MAINPEKLASLIDIPVDTAAPAPNIERILQAIKDLEEAERQANILKNIADGINNEPAMKAALVIDNCDVCWVPAADIAFLIERDLKLAMERVDALNAVMAEFARKLP